MSDIREKLAELKTGTQEYQDAYNDYAGYWFECGFDTLAEDYALMYEALEKIAVGDGELEHGGNNCECYECIAEQTLDKINARFK